MMKKQKGILILALLVLAFFAINGGSLSTTNAPAEVAFDRERAYNYDGENTVWQYFQEYSDSDGTGWYVYRHNQPEVSNLLLTQSDWSFVTGQGATKVDVKVIDTEISSNIGLGAIRAGATGTLLVTLKNDNDAGQGGATIIVTSPDNKSTILNSEQRFTFDSGEVTTKTYGITPISTVSGLVTIDITVVGDESEPIVNSHSVKYNVLGQGEPSIPPEGDFLTLTIIVIGTVIVGFFIFTRRR